MISGGHGSHGEVWSVEGEAGGTGVGGGATARAGVMLTTRVCMAAHMVWPVYSSSRQVYH